jgi:hypothetical protein
MSEVEIFKWFVIIIVGGFTFMLKRELNLKDEDIRSLKAEVQSIKQNYLHRDDFKEFKSELRSMFEEIKKDIRTLRHHEED